MPSEQRRVVELIDLGSLTPASAAGVEGITGARLEVTGAVRGGRLAALPDQCCALTLDACGVPIACLPPPE